MSRIQSLFQRKRSNILSFYCTAGYPLKNSTALLVAALEKAGADMIEIGIPFSDPLADGTTIQESSRKALGNGMTLSLLLEELRNIRETTKVPLVLMGYLNPVMSYGAEAFCRDAAACGIDGLIIPDLPPEVYASEWMQWMRPGYPEMIFLVTPASAEERVRYIDSISTGFLYMVTAATTTGSGLQSGAAAESYWERLSRMALKNPLMAGFGIRSKSDFEHVCRYAQGGIVGSSFIQVLPEGEKGLDEAVSEFVQMFR